MTATTTPTTPETENQLPQPLQDAINQTEVAEKAAVKAREKCDGNPTPENEAAVNKATKAYENAAEKLAFLDRQENTKEVKNRLQQRAANAGGERYASGNEADGLRITSTPGAISVVNNHRQYMDYAPRMNSAADDRRLAQEIDKCIPIYDEAPEDRLALDPLYAPAWALNLARVSPAKLENGISSSLAKDPAFRNMVKEVQNAISTQTDTKGGHLIPVQTLAAIRIKLKDHGGLLSALRQITTASGEKIILPLVSIDDMKGVWVAEAAKSATDDTAWASTATLSSHKLSSKVFSIPFEAMRDIPGIMTIVMDMMAEAIARALSDALIRGDGRGKPSGLVKELAGVAARVITTAEESVVGIDDLPKLIKGVDARYNNPFMVMHRDTMLDIMTGMKDKNGRPFFMPIDNLQTQAQIERIFGARVLLDGSFDKVAAGKTPILYGDLMKWAILRMVGVIRLRQQPDAPTDSTQYVSYSSWDWTTLDSNAVSLLFVKAPASDD